jgi:hypothetical protein
VKHAKYSGQFDLLTAIHATTASLSLTITAFGLELALAKEITSIYI